MQNHADKSESIGSEISAPSGYYVPIEKSTLDFSGRTLLYVRGSICIEASCCGAGSWEYVSILGYVNNECEPHHQGRPMEITEDIEVDRVVDEDDKKSIRLILNQLHPNARIEFR